MDIVKETRLIRNYIIGLRKYFHRNPELGFGEFNTAKRIKEELEKIGVEYTEIAKTGIVATIGKGDGRIIALRSDMDALKIQENTGVEYASQIPGVMHACGHDAHMASLIGAAIILKKYEDEIPGKVVLIFQPAEEIASGAKLVMENADLDDVDEIFGLHVLGDVQCGKISIEAGPRMAASHKFNIKILGKSGHAGKPQQCVDATVVAANMVLNLQAIISREINPIEPAVISIGRLISGSAHNIISGEAVIEGTVRIFSMETGKQIETAIKRIAYSTAIAHGATAIIEYSPAAHPVVLNDEIATNTAIEGAKKIFDENSFIKIPPMMLGEDFSVYQMKIPGVFAFVGAANVEMGRDHPNHNDKFNIDERAVIISTRLYLAYAMEALNKPMRKHN